MRPARAPERLELERALRHAGIGPASLERDAVVIFDEYTSDGPGYAGPLAVALGGEPELVVVFVQVAPQQVTLGGVSGWRVAATGRRFRRRKEQTDG